MIRAGKCGGVVTLVRVSTPAWIARSDPRSIGSTNSAGDPGSLSCSGQRLFRPTTIQASGYSGQRLFRPTTIKASGDDSIRLCIRAVPEAGRAPNGTRLFHSQRSCRTTRSSSSEAMEIPGASPESWRMIGSCTSAIIRRSLTSALHVTAGAAFSFGGTVSTI